MSAQNEKYDFITMASCLMVIIS